MTGEGDDGWQKEEMTTGKFFLKRLSFLKNKHRLMLVTLFSGAICKVDIAKGSTILVTLSGKANRNRIFLIFVKREGLEISIFAFDNVHVCE